MTVLAAAHSAPKIAFKTPCGVSKRDIHVPVVLEGTGLRASRIVIATKATPTSLKRAAIAKGGLPNAPHLWQRARRAEVGHSLTADGVGVDTFVFGNGWAAAWRWSRRDNCHGEVARRIAIELCRNEECGYLARSLRPPTRSPLTSRYGTQTTKRSTDTIHHHRQISHLSMNSDWTPCNELLCQQTRAPSLMRAHPSALRTRLSWPLSSAAENTAIIFKRVPSCACRGCI